MLAYKSQPTSRLFFWNFFFLENCWLFFPCMKVVRRIDQKESRIYAGDNKLDFPDWNLSAFALSLFFFFLTVSFFLPVASLRAGDSSIIWWINIVHPVKSLNFKNFSPISSVVAEMVSTRNITPKCTSSLSLVGNLQRKKIGGRRRRRWKKKWRSLEHALTMVRSPDRTVMDRVLLCDKCKISSSRLLSNTLGGLVFFFYLRNREEKTIKGDQQPKV